MIRNHLFTLAALVISFIYQTSYAQEVIATSGDYYENPGGSVSFTIGELAIQTLEGNGTILTQGYQQSLLIVTRVDEIEGIPYEIHVYPNPTTSSITLSYSGNDIPKLTYRLVGAAGKVLNNGEIYDEITILQFEHLPPATYFLQVMDSKKQVSTFNIVKQ